MWWHGGINATMGYWEFNLTRLPNFKIPHEATLSICQSNMVRVILDEHQVAEIICAAIIKWELVVNLPATGNHPVRYAGNLGIIQARPFQSCKRIRIASEMLEKIFANSVSKFPT